MSEIIKKLREKSMGFRKKSEESPKKHKSARTKRRETQGLDYAKEIGKKSQKKSCNEGEICYNNPRNRTKEGNFQRES